MNDSLGDFEIDEDLVSLVESGKISKIDAITLQNSRDLRELAAKKNESDANDFIRLTVRSGRLRP